MCPEANHPEPVDPDVDLAVAAQRAELAHHPLILGAIAAGGVIGAESRYGLAELMPHQSGTWPWATLLTNLLGSLLIGALMALLQRSSGPPRLARPFFGVGILGGFTTFSTYAVDLRSLLAAGHPAAAIGYGAVSLVGGLLCVVAGHRAAGGVVAR